MSDIGDGATITFGTSSFTGEFKTLQHTGVSRASVPTTHLATSPAKTFMPGDLYDPGEISGVFAYDPDTQPPFSGVAETITLTFPVPTGKSTGATLAASGFITDFSEPSLETDTEMQANITIKLSGALTYTDAAV